MPRQISNSASVFKNGRKKRRQGSGKKSHQRWQLKRLKPRANHAR